MTFKWKISAPARIARTEGVELNMAGVECEFETGSAAEAVGVFEQEDAEFTKIFGFSPLSRVEFNTAASDTAEANIDQQPTSTDAAPAASTKRRGRPPKAAPEVVAPDPIPVDPTTAAAALAGPAAAAPSPAPQPALPTPSAPAADTTPNPNGIPAFLDRTGSAAAAPPPPPPLPTVAAPPIATAAPPPVGVLGPKVVAALDEHKKRGSDDGKALADWLADTGLTIKGANYDDACRAVLMISDEKIKAAGILAPLGIAA